MNSGDIKTIINVLVYYSIIIAICFLIWLGVYIYEKRKKKQDKTEEEIKEKIKLGDDDYGE